MSFGWAGMKFARRELSRIKSISPTRSERRRYNEEVNKDTCEALGDLRMKRLFHLLNSFHGFGPSVISHHRELISGPSIEVKRKMWHEVTRKGDGPTIAKRSKAVAEGLRAF